MQAVLKQMAAVPGVFGGLACDAEGKLLSQGVGADGKLLTGFERQ